MPTYHERFDKTKNWHKLRLPEGRFLQGAELDDLQQILAHRARGISDAIFKDGDLIKGCEVLIDTVAQTAQITAGCIYLQGHIFELADVTGLAVPNTGERIIGVLLTRSTVDNDADATLRGPEPGTRAHGEPGSDRLVITPTWAVDPTGLTTDQSFHPVYRVQDGVVLDLKAPPQYDAIAEAISRNDRDANGSYIVSGWKVSALGKAGNEQHFSISEGVANINGYKRERSASLRHCENEVPDLLQIDAEIHSFADGGSGTAILTLNHAPIASIVTAIITKEKTETITRGPTADTADALPDTSVTEIVSVTQGATTYVATTDFIRTGDTVDWSPGGAEPLASSSYDVTYRYLDAVTPDSNDDTTVTLSGGVTDEQCIISYLYKLPRIDLMVAVEDGTIAYIKGISAAIQTLVPRPPSGVLPLAEIHNDWFDTPLVRNVGVGAIPVVEVDRLRENFYDLADLVAQDRLRNDLTARAPAARRGMFVDPLWDDTLRDAGVSQDAAVFGGLMQLAIVPTINDLTHDILTLPYTHEIVIEQALCTSETDINPYDSFSPLPQTLELDPPVDNWTAFSDATRAFLGSGGIVIGSGAGQFQLVSEQRNAAQLMRVRNVDFTVREFGPGEEVATVTFDGIDVTPVGTIIADGNGTATGTFTIPANVTTGRKQVIVTGNGPSEARAEYLGEGTIITQTFQRVAAIPPPPPPPIFVPQPWGWGGLGGEGGGGWGDAPDPVGQSFRHDQPRMLSGISVKFADTGDVAEKSVLQLRGLEVGFPSREVFASVDIDMATITLDDWTFLAFPLPQARLTNEWTSFTLLTNDPDHAVGQAVIGEYDADAGQWVTEQPYQIGVKFSSSNATSWTIHQDEDLTFRVHAASFSSTDVTTTLGVVAVTDMSDFSVRANITIPDARCRVDFIIERPGEDDIICPPNQNIELDAKWTGNVTVKARLQGTTTHSPILWNGTQFVAGEISLTGDYQSRKIDCGNAARIQVVYEAIIPSGASVTVKVEDQTPGSFTTVALDSTVPLEGQWQEYEHVVDPHTADPQTSLRIELAGGPDARVRVRNPRCVTT